MHVFKSHLVRFSVIVAEGISFGRRPSSMNNFTFHISAQLELMRKDYWQPVLQDDWMVNMPWKLERTSCSWDRRRLKSSGAIHSHSKRGNTWGLALFHSETNCLHGQTKISLHTHTQTHMVKVDHVPTQMHTKFCVYVFLSAKGERSNSFHQILKGIRNQSKIIENRKTNSCCINSQSINLLQKKIQS